MCFETGVSIGDVCSIHKDNVVCAVSETDVYARYMVQQNPP